MEDGEKRADRCIVKPSAFEVAQIALQMDKDDPSSKVREAIELLAESSFLNDDRFERRYRRFRCLKDLSDKQQLEEPQFSYELIIGTGNICYAQSHPAIGSEPTLSRLKLA